VKEKKGGAKAPEEIKKMNKVNRQENKRNTKKQREIILKETTV